MPPEVAGQGDGLYEAFSACAQALNSDSSIARTNLLSQALDLVHHRPHVRLQILALRLLADMYTVSEPEQARKMAKLAGMLAEGVD
jgi:hypothetical protein